MRNILKRNIRLLTLVLGVLVVPQSVYAAKIYLEAEHTAFFVSDTVLVDVKVDTEGKEINAIDGRILLDQIPAVATVRDLSVAGSVFSLWPEKPTLSEDLKMVSFAGGVPSGFNEPGATLFKIAFDLKTAGNVTLTPTDISAYLNDGKGTKDVASVQKLTIAVATPKTGYTSVNDLDRLVAGDTTLPEPFDIIAGQDSSVFEGKKFLSFGTTDSQSGVKYYEVTEGALSPVRREGTYVLQDQVTGNTVTVAAYVAAGNRREAVYTPEPVVKPEPVPTPLPSYLLIALATVVLLLLGTFVFFVRRRRNI